MSPDMHLLPEIWKPVEEPRIPRALLHSSVVEQPMLALQTNRTPDESY